MEVEYCKWLNDINKVPVGSESGGRLALYKIYKEEPFPEEYIIKVIPRDRRRVLVMLRSGCLGLAIETGRYRSPKIPLSQRKCHVCASDSVEDEVHFICVCPAYNYERISLFNLASDLIDNFYSLSSINKTVEVLKLCGSDLEIGKIIHKMYKKRSSLISSDV